jgi:hypothetical protein
MHIPTKQQWQIVIDNFEKVLPYANKRKDHLDMMECNVNIFNAIHECGSVHCVGGWYAIATLDLTTPRDFIDGARRMAKDLGFHDELDMGDFAAANKDIWGNDYGGCMFSTAKAYGGASNLNEVIEHFKGVRDRSPE